MVLAVQAPFFPFTYSCVGQSNTTQTLPDLQLLLHCDLVSAHSAWRMALAMAAGTAELCGVQPCPHLSPSSARVCFSTWCWLNCKIYNQENLKGPFSLLGPICSSGKIKAGHLEASLWLGSFVLMWGYLTQRVFALSSYSASSMLSSDCFLHPPESSHHLFQGFLCRFFEDRGIWGKIWWWSTCVLTAHYLLLLVFMFCLFPRDYFFCIPSLLLSLKMQISSGFLLIFFQLIKCLWGRREPEVWSVPFKHTLHAASNFFLLFTVTSITNWSEKKCWFYFEKMEKGFFTKFSENWKKEKGFLSTLWKKSPSHSYLHAAKFTE